MTPLQKAAQALMDAMAQTDFTCRLGEQLDACEKALDAEIAQAAEPVGHFLDCGKPKTMGDVQDMCIAALQRDERAKVGDSRFESWYSELNQAGKGSKQIVREAYEAGLNEAEAQQAKRVPLTDDQIQEIYIHTYTAVDHGRDFENAFARAIEAHHDIPPADKPTVDEPEDLYALALKADNWGQLHDKAIAAQGEKP